MEHLAKRPHCERPAELCIVPAYFHGYEMLHERRGSTQAAPPSGFTHCPGRGGRAGLQFSQSSKHVNTGLPRYNWDMCQDIQHIGSSHNRSATPFTAGGGSPKVVTAQYNNPSSLYSSENLQTFNHSVESRSSTGDQEPSKNLNHLNQPPSNLAVDKDSEVYKMLQENQDSNEPPRQSTSFLVLQEMLESDGKGDPNKPSGFRSVKAPATKIAASIGNSQKLSICGKCGSGIVGVFVRIRDKQLHPECYVCSDCGTNLKQKGHFFVEESIYCEKHARERVTPPEGYEVVTVFPN